MTKDLADKEIVVFHCSLSQQRGPGAALKYLRERDGGVTKEGGDKDGKEDGELEKAGKGEEDGVENKDGGGVGNRKKKQEVYVLDGGFVKWQEVYV